MPQSLDPIFRPKTIAVIGASKKPETLGYKVFHNLVSFGFEGAIFPVNPKAEYILGHTCYKSVLEIPGPVDQAIIIVAKELVKEVIDQCGRKGVKGVIVISAGFKEIGGDGIAREEEILAKAKEYNMRMVGPNCMGVFNTDPEVRMEGTFAPTQPHPGNIGFISQSGALGAVVLELANHLKLGLSLFTSMGNKADISGNDLMEYYHRDRNTDVILMYLESLGNPRRFLQIARKVTREKPVIVVKAGKTSAGAMAATSHTGAMADSDVAIDAMFHQCGVIRVSTIEEMFTMAMSFANQPLPKGKRVAVLSNAGGPGILATDALISRNLELAAFTEQTTAKLREMLPEEASVRNPVDMISTADEEDYRAALEILLDDENVDAVLVIFVTPILVKSSDVANKIAQVIHQHPGKTVVTCLMGHEGILSGVKELEKHKIPVYRFPESAVQALAAMRHYQEIREREYGSIGKFKVDRNTVKRVIEKARAEGRTLLYDAEVRSILHAYGFPLARVAAVRTVDEAVEAAKSIGGPVVVKLLSKTITHKSDVGGVQVDLRSEEEVRSAVSTIIYNVQKRFPGEKIDGFLVQEMVKGGKETVMGMSLDPKCGPVLMFGLGGIYVEVLKEVSFRIAPLTDRDAREMIESLKSYPLLKGVRGEAPVDIDFIIENLQRLSQLASDFDEIQEMDINPFIVGSQRERCKIVDARVVIREA